MMQMMKNTSALRTCRPVSVSHVRRPCARRPALIARAAAPKSGIAQFSDSIGLPTNEGLFGFKPFSEVWCGRLAMMGFISSILVEFQTGKGTLQQLGLNTPSVDLLGLMGSALLAATLVGTAVTAYKGFSGKLTSQEAQRYKEFLLLNNEEALIESTRKEGTVADAFFSANSTQAIDAARSEGMIADRVLGAEVDGDVAAARAAGMPADAVLSISSAEEVPAASMSKPAPVQSYDDVVFSNSELRYARSVELSNGRSAMVGFLAAVLVEAATGKGILMQLLMWGKFSGLLGAESGF